MFSERHLSVFAISVCASLALAVCPPAARADGSAGPVKYSNGDVATAAAKCGPGDVCATLTLASGDTITVLTGGSGLCNPYVMTFMRYHQGHLAAVWSTPTDRSPDSSSAFGGAKCGGFRNTHMTIDGIVDMGIFQNKDGTVFVQFFGGSS